MRMTHAHKALKRQAVNVSLPAELVQNARRLSVNISAVTETALIQTVQDAELQAWAATNRNKFEALNELIELEGLPLQRLRRF
ncbi:MAG TPA: plasmid maintenance protein CcdB [Hyphomonadaceae bacterium]|nr:plasmid maintenance protein CcdB [Hyphomonadaceae bacterium]